MIIVRAELADLHRLLRFRTDTARWLSALGSDQWALPFPAESIIRSIEAGEVYLIREAHGTDAAATITLDTEADPLLWTETERAQPAFYVHKLTVDRQYAGRGLGTRLLDWAGDRAAQRGATWLRLDAWTTNARLQAYYRANGFNHVRTVMGEETGGSGWVAQRPASRAAHGFTEEATPPRSPGLSTRD
ncbi:GNAT family N-acetyltransferase [Streptomyces sp. NPDC090132]|uniref:GNAT family N-acetyltransferase n=1 Tax=Streptomyces sp. NPDC090132 TaxID=3365955 RepID=UPI0038290B9A